MIDKRSKLLDFIGNQSDESKRVFQDLNLSDVFKSINYTNSKVGEQYLYYSLYNLKSNNKELKEFEDKIEHINKLKDINLFKQKISLLNKNRSYNLVETIFSQWLHLPYWWYNYSPVLFLLLILTIFGFVFLPTIFIYPVILIPSIYLIFHLINKGFVYYTIEFFQNLNDFISVISYINEKTSIYTFESQKQFKNNSFLINILLFNETIDNKNMFFGAISFIIDLLKGLFLIDILIISYLKKKFVFNKNLESDFLKLGN